MPCECLGEDVKSVCGRIVDTFEWVSRASVEWHRAADQDAVGAMLASAQKTARRPERSCDDVVFHLHDTGRWRDANPGRCAGTLTWQDVHLDAACIEVSIRRDR